MTDRIGIGVVGAGIVGQYAHLATFATLARAEIVALAELRPRLRRAVAEKCRIPATYATHEEMLRDPRVDAVVVVTRRPATGPVVLDALRARKHVLSEKPMALTVAQGEALAAAATSADVRYAIGYMKRYEREVEDAKRAIESRALGVLLRIRAYGFGGNTEAPTSDFVMTDEPRPNGLLLWPVAPEWLPARFTAAYDAFLNVHSHLVNLVRYLVGKPVVLSARIEDPAASEIAATIDEAPCVFELGSRQDGPWTEGIELWFERGKIAVALPPPFRKTEDWAFKRQAQEFVDDVILGREPRAGGSDSVDDLRFAEDAWRATLAALVS